MWPVLLAAAVAGTTGLIAKYIFSPNIDLATGNPVSEQNQKGIDRHEEEEAPVDSEEPKTPLVKNSLYESGYQSNCEKQDRIFRFSSSGSRGKSGSRSGSKIFRKKIGLGARGSKKLIGDDKIEKRSAVGVEVSRRRVAVCLKKMRTTKHVVGKRGSCSNKDGSLFGWGLGVGIMYMMSAGKTEISKLNAAMDETTKAVQELRTEIYRRKSLHNLQVSSSAYEVTANPRDISGKDSQLVLNKSSTGDRGPHDIKASVLPLFDDGEYASSVLTEEPEPEPDVLEMDRLEAELESELQKLPWWSAETYNLDGIRPNPIKAEVSAEGYHGLVEQNSESYQHHGVLPSELDQKLCHLLIQQQGNQIEELEAELRMAQSKLHQKEAELQAFKNCVRGLTESSLSTVSDDENEAKEEQELTNVCDHYINTGSEARKSVIGIKRPIESLVG